MIIPIPDVPTTPLQEVQLVPDQEAVTRSGVSADITILLSTPNRVIVQSVFVQPFTDYVDPEVLAKIDQKNLWLAAGSPHSPEFKVVHSFLTCMPAPSCRLTWLRASYELGAGPDPALRPIVCAMFPQAEQDSFKHNSSFEISSKLTIKAVEVGAKKGDSTEREEKRVRIMTYGLAGSIPAWDFSATPVNPELQGDMHLLMVVAVPPRSTHGGALKLSARAELRGLAIPLVTRRTQSSSELQFEIR